MEPSKIALLARLNNQAQLEYDAAKDMAMKKGRPAPPAPVPLTEEQIEYPKWLHKGWKASGKGRYEPTESLLVKSKEEHDAAGDDWSDSPPKAEASSKKPETKSTKLDNQRRPTVAGKDDAKA